MSAQLSSREIEIISTLLGSLDIGSNGSEKDSVSAILSVIKKKGWTKYDFHNLNIAARYFVRICEKIGISNSIPEELEVFLPNDEQIILDYYSMHG